jgi:flagellar hook-associated protein 3 FlgL
VLTQLADIASNFAASALGVATSSGAGVTALADQAKAALDQVKGLLNTRVGDAYLLSGADTANPPIDDTALSGFIGNVQASVFALAANGATATGNSVLATASLGSIVTPTIGSTPVMAETGPGQTVPQGVVAGQNLSQPATRSYVKDLVAGLAALAGLKGTTADQSTRASFGAAMSNMLQGAGAGIATDQAVLGEAQSEIATRQTALSDTVTTLTKQVSGVEEVDMAATATALAQVKTQLDASYQLIAAMRDMTLTHYL